LPVSAVVPQTLSLNYRCRASPGSACLPGAGPEENHDEVPVAHEITHPLGDDFVIPGTCLNAPAPEASYGADPFSGRHHPWQRQRRCAGGAYLAAARRRETGRRNRKRLRVTLRRPGLQGKNPVKKERS